MESKEINTKDNPTVFLRDRFNLFSFLLAFLLNILCWTLPYFQIKPQVEPIILHYNIYFGVDLIGSWYRIFYLPAIALALLLVNLILGAIINKKDKVICRIFLGSGVAIQVLALIGIYLLTHINT